MEEMSKRFTATAAGEKWMFILANLDDGPGLAALNLKTGEVDSEIVLKDKKPDYEIDELEKRVFYYKKKNELQCFSF